MTLGTSGQPIRETGPHFVAIDDSDASLTSVRRALKTFGFSRLTTFKDPEAALEAFSSEALSPDIILVDYMMPRMDGVETCARIRMIEATSETPIIILTGQGNTEIMANAFMAGANDYISKSFDKVEFEARIRSCLRLKAELDRRKASEAPTAPSSTVTSQIGLVAEISVPPLLLSSVGFQSAISKIHPSRWPELSFVTMGVAPVRKAGASAPGIAPEKLAAILARVEKPSSALFAPLDSHLYCCALVDSDGKEAHALARRFQKAVSMANLFDPRDPMRRPIELRVAVKGIAKGTTLAAALADAILRIW